MNSKIKIRISQKAYNELLKLLDDNKEYNCINFSYYSTCCQNGKISISLDNLKDNYIKDIIDNLNIIYNKDLLREIKQIDLVYKNNSFYVKAIPLTNTTNSCNSCCKKSCYTCNKNMQD
ncbi:hypothetical protein [Clostridium rectalis]|uniref:hypothetical protein n=1 Tax=Clostridium rectalis TaxID=2040295 RepID=UPI000F641F43|nr:hypothetical protein [Clostridium rectalis]